MRSHSFVREEKFCGTEGAGLAPGRTGLEEEEKAHVLALRHIRREVPSQTDRAAASLDLFLRGIYASPWQEVAWSFSRLTGDGFPVEFSFSSADEAIRYTTEVAGPEADEGRRLDQALHHLEILGQPPLPEMITSLFHRIQKFDSLRYGTWVGGRHGVDCDRFKLYVEVPGEGVQDAYRFLGPLIEAVPFLSLSDPRLVMIGYEPSSSRIESYFRCDYLEPWEVSLLMRNVGLTSRVEELLNLVEEASGAPIQRVLSMQPLGFSFAINFAGEPPLFSLFTTAGAIFGGDGSIRRRMLELGSRKGWNLRTYESVSEPLAGRTGWNTWHGLISFVAVHDGPPILQIGLRPPEVSQ
jgi:hypothetical protein